MEIESKIYFPGTEVFYWEETEGIDKAIPQTSCTFCGVVHKITGNDGKVIDCPICHGTGYSKFKYVPIIDYKLIKGIIISATIHIVGGYVFDDNDGYTVTNSPEEYSFEGSHYEVFFPEQSIHNFQIYHEELFLTEEEAKKHKPIR